MGYLDKCIKQVFWSDLRFYYSSFSDTLITYFTGSDGEYSGPADITFEDMRKAFTHVTQYEHQDDIYWVLGRGAWDWYYNKPRADHTYGNESGKS